MIRHFTLLATLLGLTFIFGLSGHASSLPAPMGTGVSGTLIADTTWTAAGNPYVLDGQVTIASNVTLTVEPGVIVQGGSTSLLLVSGTLSVTGTVESPVVFTSSAAEPKGGDWLGVYFLTGSSGQLRHTIVEFAGKYWSTYPYSGWNQAIRIDSPNVMIEDAKIRYNFGHGILFQAEGMVRKSQIIGNASNGVRVIGGSVTIHDNLIQNNGQGIEMLGADITVTENEIISNTLAVTVVGPRLARVQFVNNTLSGNGSDSRDDAITIYGGINDGEHTWPEWLADYRLIWVGSDVNSAPKIATGATLILPAGATFHIPVFRPVEVSGRLETQGTAASPVVFTSNALEPRAGDWDGIYFLAGSSGLLSHAVVEYAGRYRTNNPYRYWNQAIQTDSPDVSIENSIVRHSSGVGIQVQAAISLQYSVITRNQTGIRIAGQPNALIQNNSITDNSQYGVFQANSNLTADVRNNWWGDASGPQHTSNTGGLGNAVSNGVEFDPWLTSAPEEEPEQSESSSAAILSVQLTSLHYGYLGGTIAVSAYAHLTLGTLNPKTTVYHWISTTPNGTPLDPSRIGIQNITVEQDDDDVILSLDVPIPVGNVTGTRNSGLAPGTYYAVVSGTSASEIGGDRESVAFAVRECQGAILCDIPPGYWAESEIIAIYEIGTVTLADLLLLFIYTEVLGMIGVFYASNRIPITLPLFIAMTAISRLIILQGKGMDASVLLYEAGAILIIAFACLVIRYRPNNQYEYQGEPVIDKDD